MEDIGFRIPLILEEINKLLDNKTLTNCMEVSSTFYDVIGDQRSGRFLIARKIQSYLKNSNEFENDWMIVVKKLPIQKLKEFAILVKKFYNAVPKRTKQKWSPMHVAAECGRLDLCKLIVKETSVKNPTGLNKLLPIHFAAQAGHLEVYEFLTEDIAEKNPEADRRLSPLHLAAKNGHLQIYQFIGEQALDKNPMMDEDITPLHLAAQSGHIDVCKYICGNTRNVRPRRFFDGATPLRLAIPGGQMRIAKLLIDNDTLNFNYMLPMIAALFLVLWLSQLSGFILGASLFGVEKQMQHCSQAQLIGWLIETMFNQTQDLFCRNLFLHYDLHVSILYTIPIYFSLFMFAFLITPPLFWMVSTLLEKFFSSYVCPILDY